MSKEIALEVANPIEGFQALNERPEVMVTYVLLEETPELCALRDKISNNGLTAGFKFSAGKAAYERFLEDCERSGINLADLPIKFDRHANIATQPYFMKPAPGLLMNQRGKLGAAFGFATDNEDLGIEGFWLQSNEKQKVGPKKHLDLHSSFTANWYLSGHGVGYEVNGTIIKPKTGTAPILTMHRGTGHEFPAAPHRGYPHEPGIARANMFATFSPSDRIMNEFYSRPLG